MRFFVVAVVAAAFAGCTLFGDFDGFTGGDGVAADAAPEEAAAPDSPPGEEGGGVADAGLFDDAGCPIGRGPAMVRATSFCIDATEVTVAQYREFLDAVGLLPDKGASLQPAARCAWNQSYVPPYFYPATSAEIDAGVPASVVDTMPINVVDWCDAYAYCAWAGKRLCGSTQGGSLPAAQAESPESEWFVACSRNGTRAYPYGPSFDSQACNDQAQPNRRLPVASHPGCVGGFDGLFDMSGNLEEWIDACDDSNGAVAPEDVPCAIKGGAFNFPEGSMGCAVPRLRPRNNQGPQSGIRCCASVSP